MNDNTSRVIDVDINDILPNRQISNVWSPMCRLIEINHWKWFGNVLNHTYIYRDKY